MTSTSSPDPRDDGTTGSGRTTASPSAPAGRARSTAHRRAPRHRTGGRRAHPPGTRVLAALVVLGLVALVAPVGAQSAPTMVLSPSQGPVGTVVELRAAGLPAGFEAVVRLDDPERGPLLLDGVTVGEDRSVAGRFTIPRGTVVGIHVIHLCVSRSAATTPACPVQARFEVTAPPVDRPEPTEPPPRPPTQPDPTDPTRPDPPGPGPTVPPGQGDPSVPPGGTPPSDPQVPVGPGPDQPDFEIVFPTPDPSNPGDVGIATTTTPTTTVTGPGGLAGSTSSTGLGMGELQGSDTLPDLRITGLELTQGIQNMDNDMPLVAHRTTVLRVYVQTDGDTLPHVSGAVQLVRDGSHEVAVLEPDNGPFTATAAAPDRSDPDASLNFTLPPEATGFTAQGDKLILTAFVFSTHPSTPAQQEPTDVNNYEAEVFEFHQVAPLTVRLVPIHVHEQPIPFAPDATIGNGPEDQARILATMIAMYRYLPVSDIQALVAPTVYPPLHNQWVNGTIPPQATEWNLEAEDVEDSILDPVLDIWAETSPESALDQVHAVYRSEVPFGWGGYSNGIVSYGFIMTDSHETWPWYHQGAWLTAHELGHNFGLDHVDCSGSEDNPDPNYPYLDPCLMAPVDPEGWYGWDVRHHALPDAEGPTVVSPDPADTDLAGYPFMGYQGPKWADPWSYCRSLELFEVECTALPIPENQVANDALPEAGADTSPSASNDHDTWVELQSVSFPSTSGAAPEPARLHSSEIIPRPLPHVLAAHERIQQEGDPTGVVARVVEADGDEHEIEYVVVAADGDGDAAGDDQGVSRSVLATVVMPWTDDAVAVQLVQDGEVIAERRPSAGAPVVDVVSPGPGDLQAPVEIGWTASDPDGDALTFDLAYSPDGGETWTALAADLTDTSHTLESFDLVAGGSQAIFRVRASDGMRTTDATSAPANVADQPPTVGIVGPVDGTVLPLHGTANLEAMAWDRESTGDDGDGVTLRWTSNLDGELGEGRQVVTQELTAGEHVITVTATDRSGNEATAAVTVTIDPGSAQPRLDAGGRDALRVAFASGPTNPVPPGAAGTDRGGAYGWAAAALVVAGLAGAVVALRRSRRPHPSTPDPTGR